MLCGEQLKNQSQTQEDLKVREDCIVGGGHNGGEEVYLKQIWEQNIGISGELDLGGWKQGGGLKNYSKFQAELLVDGDTLDSKDQVIKAGEYVCKSQIRKEISTNDPIIA